MKCRMLSALFLALGCSSAFAQQQALITVNPNLYAPGQNISNATFGAQLQSFSTVPNPDPNNPGTRVPQYSPVYAQPVDASCTFEPGVPCSIGGNLAFGPTGAPAAFPFLWGDVNVAADCVEELAFASFCDGFLAFQVLRVNFTTPTDYAAAVIGYFGGDASEIQAFEAFDSGGNSLGHCIAPISFTFPPTPGLPPDVSDPPGCATAVLAGQFSGWGLFAISRPSADISFVLIGGFTIERPVAQVIFDSPVSLQLAGLLAAVRGVGPGKSLANTVIQTQADYAAGDLTTTCSLLASLVGELNAQNGKHIDAVTDAQLRATATAIQAGVGCN